MGFHRTPLSEETKAKIRASLAQKRRNSRGHIVSDSAPSEPPAPAEPVPGQVVYFILAPDHGLLKIGTTGDLTKRLASLWTMSPARLELVAVMVGGTREEQALHARFDALRAHGEWFQFEGELRAYVESLVGAARCA